jgi:hypothetical protein
MNSSGFSGTGALAAANAVYLDSTSADLVIGTTTSNAVHFVVNSGATDAATISSSGIFSLGTPLAVGSGGLGISTTPANGYIPIGNGTNYTAAALTAGSNITITNTAGGITIASTGGGGSGTVTSVAQTFTGGLISVSGSPITSSGTLALTVAGTSGGIPYFGSASTWASSAALTANALMIGGGAGAAPATTTTGTGVLTALGNTTNAASGIVVKDANANITTNALYQGFTNAAATTTITLTASSTPNRVVTGSGGQTFTLPDATTLPVGATFTFNNNQSSGAITVNNNSSTLIVSIPSGGFATVILLTNSAAAGTWDYHFGAPANVSWSTNTFDYPGSITSATWNGVAVAPNRGGTGVANNSASTLTISGAYATTLTISGTTSLTLPTSGTVTALGNTVTGTGNIVLATSPTLATPTLGAASATSINKVAITAPATSATLTLADTSTLATSGAFSITLTSTAATNVTLPTSGTLVNTAVTTLSSLTSVGTIGTGTWQGTVIGSAYGGTAQTTYTTGDILYASAANTLSKLAIGSNTQVLTVVSGAPAWAAASGGGSGTVASSTIGQVPVYTGATTVTGNANLTYATGALTIGVAGSQTGTLLLSGGTSGTTTLAVAAAASGTLTLPAGTGTVIATVNNMASNPVTGTPTSSNFLRGDGTWATPAGSGTITSSTAGQIPVYTAATTIGGNANLTYATGALTLGVAGTQAGTLVLSGGTSGTTTIAVAAAATGTVTLPAATTTLAGLGVAQTFTATNTFNQINYTNNTVTVTSNAGTVPITYRLNTFTNSSAATMAITMATASAVDGQMSIVRIYDATNVVQTIGWTNTENSATAVPLSSNGSTTLPVTVGFMYNSQTSKWRCIASS